MIDFNSIKQSDNSEKSEDIIYENVDMSAPMPFSCRSDSASKDTLLKRGSFKNKQTNKQRILLTGRTQEKTNGMR